MVQRGITGSYGKLESKICQIKVLNFFRFTPKKRQVQLKKDKGIIFFNPGIGRKMPFYTANIIFVGAVIYGIYLYLPVISAVAAYKKNPGKTVVQREIIATTNVATGSAKIEDKSYRLLIPKISAEAEVVENVSPYDEAEYIRVLKRNVVAQATGGKTPGSGKGSSRYIFAHSSYSGVQNVRNNAVFYLLGELKNGDEIELRYHGTSFIYRVYERKIIKANDISFIDYSDPGRDVLILQTCWPIGTDWNRLLVLAENII